MEPPNISGTVEARNFKFDKEMDGSEYRVLTEKCKIRSKGIMWESRDPLLEFWDPPNISWMIEARNFKLGAETDGNEC